MRRIISALLLSFSAFASASSIVLDPVLVDGRDNLFYENWGHWFTLPEDHALAEAGSNPAHAVMQGGVSYNFSQFDAISIFATGSVVADGPNSVGPDGVLTCAACEYDYAYYHSPHRPANAIPGYSLATYSLIGIWSSSATEIVPFGDWTDLTSGLGLLFVGSNRNLVVPDGPAAYLFLAENDGVFTDNSGAFNVTINTVPLPGALILMCSSLMALAGARRRMA